MTGASGTASADLYWMRQALALAARAEGQTSPNPRVGCLLVRGGRAVGGACHAAAGGPHAETLALSQAGPLARGATAFVSLEPCAHHGRTPPCADQLIRAGVARVVAAMIDPNPLVNGRGLERLRAAGVAVAVGPLGEDAARLNAGFVTYHTRGRPLVTLKAALSADGLIAAREGHARWVTGEPARRFSRRLRLMHDAVLIGAGTLRRDDPRLTVRLPGVRERGVRAVLAPRLSVDPAARLFAAGPGVEPRPRIYAWTGAASAHEAELSTRAEIVRVGGSPERLDLGAVLADLARLEVQSVLVEGGGRTLAGFVEAGLADQAALFVAPALFGARGATPLLDLPAVTEPAHGLRLEEPRQLALGADLLLLARLGTGQGAAA